MADPFDSRVADALSPLISSLATGNAIVIKPSELVAWSTLHYIRAVKACLVACGEDPELVQCVVTRPRDVEALTGNERVKHITFVSFSRRSGVADGRLMSLLCLRRLDPSRLVHSSLKKQQKSVRLFYSSWAARLVGSNGKLQILWADCLLRIAIQDPCIVLESADCEFFKHTWMRGVLCVLASDAGRIGTG